MSYNKMPYFKKHVKVKILGRNHTNSDDIGPIPTWFRHPLMGMFIRFGMDQWAMTTLTMRSKRILYVQVVD